MGSDATPDVKATAVRVSDLDLTVDFEDGRTVTVPLSWYPRLQHGAPDERRNFEIGCYGIHWEELDEDISFEACCWVVEAESQPDPCNSGSTPGATARK